VLRLIGGKIDSRDISIVVMFTRRDSKVNRPDLPTFIFVSGRVNKSI
jgi:hypothetical protein